MKIIFSLIATVSLLISAGSATAEQVCAPRDHAVSQLEKQFQENVSGRGLTVNGRQMIELFVSETGSWTVLASDPAGFSCVIVSGESWQGTATLIGEPA